MPTPLQSDVIIAGGGLAGIVTALECLRAGQTVTLVDRDSPERFGGLARVAFGGMALIGTPEQTRMKIRDTPELALQDWLRFGELSEHDVYPRLWAEHYVARSRTHIYDWLKREGVSFLPAVNWVERGWLGEGNTLPRYHVIWGTSLDLTERLIAALHAAARPGQLRILHRHLVTAIDKTDGAITGAMAINEADGSECHLQAPVVVLAMGGINGSTAKAIENWPAGRPRPAEMLNGAHPFADGALHDLVAKQLRGKLTHVGEMWNYAAGIPHPFPQFDGHGLSTIPCKSALWLNHRGERIGPAPLVTGFDTHALCQQVAALDKPYTWHLLNWRIAAKELALSGAEHNQRVRDKQLIRFVLETVWGNHRLVRQMQRESRHFLFDDTLEGLAAQMNALAGNDAVKPEVLRRTVDQFDANFSRGLSVCNDDQIRRIMHARQWGPDRLRTCKPAPLQAPGSGPFIAIQMRLITRKSLGGLQTDLQSRVLDEAGTPITGLYCVGEAAGFGGGGANGKRSIEGTFLSGCILTARAAAASITKGQRL